VIPQVDPAWVGCEVLYRDGELELINSKDAK
jgi:hypothetical protein